MSAKPRQACTFLPQFCMCLVHVTAHMRRRGSHLFVASRQARLHLRWTCHRRARSAPSPSPSARSESAYARRTVVTVCIESRQGESRQGDSRCTHRLDLSVSRFTTLVQLDQREACASRCQRVLALRRVGSVGLAKDEASPCSVRVDLLHHKVPLLCPPHGPEIRRELADRWHGPCSASAKHKGQ